MESLMIINKRLS